MPSSMVRDRFRRFFALYGRTTFREVIFISESPVIDSRTKSTSIPELKISQTFEGFEKARFVVVTQKYIVSRACFASLLQPLSLWPIFPAKTAICET